MKNFWKKSWFVKLVSLLIAVLLVIYIDSTQPGFMTQGENSKTQQTASETHTLKVPLQVSVNTDKYYVVGYPEKVSITLAGPNALVTSTVNTQNFRAYIDLTNKSIGKHTVRVQVSGLSKQLSYSISPKTLKVDIERRKSTTMPVQIEYNKSAVAHGYKVGKTSSNPQQVEVTGSRSEVDQIDQIVAKVVLPNGIDHSYHRQVILIAEDKHQRQLNVVIEPSTVAVTIPITIAKKTVKVSLDTKNEPSNKVYSLTSKVNEVTLYGTEESLAKIKELKVPVDLRGVDSSLTKQVELKLPDGVIKSDPTSIEVKIRVKDTGNTSKVNQN
ncbi:CdaR family protein [Lactobacillus sp. ESL0791]|uniref:CdaR family protein n=1 Tax=Lactobacillus sp. ESL0791 TaxID=2983234 RepID=UPI0023F62070|nr:CdaR family protein [Lactobacillus sp. ESL0791]MDF7638640.1 CdaR family protein [Lactobacillus sp. ESL0791]